MTMLSFRLSDADAVQVERWVKRLGVDRSEFLRDAVRHHLLKLASEEDAATWERTPPTAAELALAHVADWGPAEDWSDWADASG